MHDDKVETDRQSAPPTTNDQVHDHAAGALSRKALKAALDESRRRQEEVSALLAGARAVLSYREFESASRAIFDICKGLTGATAGYVALLTEDGTENEVLFLEAGGVDCTVDPSLPMPIRGLRESVYRTGRAVYENSFPESEWAAYLPQGHAKIDNVLFAPLTINGIVVGLLGLANKPGGFSESDVHLASAFGELAAIALLNSRTLEALQANEERFRAVAQTATDAIITIDSRGNIVFWNKAAESIFGYAADDAVGRTPELIIPERFWTAHRTTFERLVAGGEPRILGRTVEMVGLRKGGEEFPVELSLSTWKSSEGVFFTGILRDVTERVRAEKLLREQNQFIVNAIEALNHPFYVIDADDYTIKLANSAAYDGDLAQPITCHALTHQNAAPCKGDEHPCPLEEIKKTRAPVIVEHVHYDREGRRRSVEVHGHPVFDEAGNLIQVIEYTLDITDRKRVEEALQQAHDELELRVKERTAELAQANRVLELEIAQHKRTAETLRESEERYRRLLELSFEAILIHSQGKLLQINPAGAKLVGALTSEELIGKPIRDFVHPDYWDMVQLRLQQTGEGRKEAPLVEEKLVRLDGTPVEVEAASIPITYRGQPAVQSVVHDLTERRRAEREREKERERIARDLHDSLGHSLGYLRLKLDQFASFEDTGDETAFRQDVTRMRDVADQAYEIVRGMLATLHPSNADDLPTSLLALARAAGQRANFTAQLTSEGPASTLPPVVQQQLLYLFQEALNNVTKHAGAQQVDICLSWTEDTLTAALADDGCGFDVGDMEAAPGHYGLRIMQERAEEITGQLTINSRPGHGTQLLLQLPLGTDHPRGIK
jgi:PAS domain S-box-containing protein